MNLEIKQLNSFVHWCGRGCEDGEEGNTEMQKMTKRKQQQGRGEGTLRGTDRKLKKQAKERVLEICVVPAYV